MLKILICSEERKKLNSSIVQLLTVAVPSRPAVLCLLTVRLKFRRYQPPPLPAVDLFVVIF